MERTSRRRGGDLARSRGAWKGGIVATGLRLLATPLGVLAAASLATAAERVSRDPERPNVVLIMTDDQGYGDFGFTGNPVVRTPALDAMSERAALCTRFYVAPVCTPTRASLMTGRYHHRTRAIDTYIGRAMMEPEEVTIAEILRDAGYATGIFGKWHLGDCAPLRPMDQGFEKSWVHRGGGIGQPSDPPAGRRKYTDAVLFHDGVETPTEGYCTDVYFDKAIEFIDACQSAGRPFFAYVATNAPHGPFHDVPEGLRQEYAAKDLSNARFPQESGHALQDDFDADRRARIFAMITNIDDNVGRLFAELEARGLREKTLVLFLVDNGPNGRRYVAGMRGQKSDVYEGGIRSPLLVEWPGRIPAGSRMSQLAAHIDVLPTILDACSVPQLEDPELDGRSLLPVLTGEARSLPERTVVIQAHRGNQPQRYHHFALHTERWKLLHPSGFGREQFEGEARFELYDLLADPLETENVVAEHPDLVRSLLAEYDAWFDDVGSTRPDNYAPPRIHIGNPTANPTWLTVQDWRHESGRPWGANSRGVWLLEAVAEGRCAVTLFFPPNEEEGHATLRLDDREWIEPILAGAEQVSFEDVELVAGPVGLRAWIVRGGVERGPHQVRVRWENGAAD